MHEPPRSRAGADGDAPDPAADQDRGFDAERAALIARLRDDGLTDTRAVELVDSWEAEAVRRRIPLGSPAYWERARAWIGEQLDAEVEPPPGLSRVAAWIVMGGVLFALMVFQFVFETLKAALGLVDWLAFVVTCVIVIGLAVLLARRSGAWAGIRGLPGRAGWSRVRPWALVPLSMSLVVALALLGMAPLPADIQFGGIVVVTLAMPFVVIVSMFWLVKARRDG